MSFSAPRDVMAPEGAVDDGEVDVEEAGRGTVGKQSTLRPRGDRGLPETVGVVASSVGVVPLEALEEAERRRRGLPSPPLSLSLPPSFFRCFLLLSGVMPSGAGEGGGTEACEESVIGVAAGALAAADAAALPPPLELKPQEHAEGSAQLQEKLGSEKRSCTFFRMPEGLCLLRLPGDAEGRSTPSDGEGIDMGR